MAEHLRLHNKNFAVGKLETEEEKDLDALVSYKMTISHK